MGQPSSPHAKKDPVSYVKHFAKVQRGPSPGSGFDCKDLLDFFLGAHEPTELFLVRDGVLALV
ncbi:hypothetical protein AAL_01693 [Moelleriella libera RCEF 2490]|uniref:Uncharacterized protein n=1 Tax=Moelleriella libera RCEF 2490 TaxID=1081109 RepID=A0A166UD44_9HYPO|nr:hypothetical protein AAL_01693 [Moelleriella libera RCEF 2490]